jgi:hypothetical protein
MAELLTGWGRGIGGATAGLNALTFFWCTRCGCCVVEYDRGSEQRVLHDSWHEDHE